jgi:hypothetical protein
MPHTPQRLKVTPQMIFEFEQDTAEPSAVNFLSDHEKMLGRQASLAMRTLLIKALVHRTRPAGH